MTKDLQKKCDIFNTLYPVGTEVFLPKDNGDVLETATRSPAQVLSGHSAVIWLENVTGCYALERVRPKPNAGRPRGATTEEVTKAYHAWLAGFERGRTIDVEMAFAAGYRAASVPPIIREAFANERAKEEAEHAAFPAPEADPREWNLDMSAAPHDGTIVEVCARYPDATAGFPRYAGFSPTAECWLEYSRHLPQTVIPWAWRPRTDWPDMPREPRS